MNAMAEPQAFTLPKKPRVKQQEAPPDQRKVCVLPIRAVFDQRLTHGALQVLAALCAYCNRAGITWVSQTRLAKELGISQQAVAKQFKQLREHGYLETIRKGFKGERTDTLRVIFDPSVDAETAIAITSPQEDTRPPEMRQEQARQAETPDPAGQRRIAQLLAKALKSPTPRKDFTMPKEGDTRAVREVKEAMAKASKKRSKPVDKPVDQGAPNHNPEVVNGEAVQLQPGGCAIHNLEVVDNTDLTPIRQSINKDSFKELNTVLHNLNESQRSEIDKAGLNEREATEALTTLLAAYQAEGLTPNPERLATEVIQLAAVSRGIA